MIDAAPVPTVDDVAGRIKDNVWTLICAGQMDAALVLLAANAEDFQRAYLGFDARPRLALPAAPTEVVSPSVVDTSGAIGPRESVQIDPTPTGSRVYVLTGAPSGRNVRIKRPEPAQQAS